MQIQFCFSCEHKDNPKRYCKKYKKQLVDGTNGFMVGFERCDECMKETANHFKKYEEKK